MRETRRRRSRGAQVPVCCTSSVAAHLPMRCKTGGLPIRVLQQSFEHVGDPLMFGLELAWWDACADRALDEMMRKGVLIAVAVCSLADDLAVEQIVEGVLNALLIPAGDPRQKLGIEHGAHDGGDLDKPEAIAGEPLEAFGEDPGKRVRGLLDELGCLWRARFDERVNQLRDNERVAVAHGI